jgi:hypothetical protein
MSLHTPDHFSDEPEIRESADARRFQAALAEVISKFPVIESQIRKSLRTPQMGDYHNEGPHLDAHVSLILKNLEDIRSGIFHPSISEGSKAVIRKVVSGPDGEINENLRDYAFLHDIAKPDSLMIKYDVKNDRGKVDREKSDSREITWEEWEELERQGPPYRFHSEKLKGPVEINSISWFHQSKGALGKHGARGVDFLKDKVVLPRAILVAIHRHEIAYMFENISASNFERHFLKADPEEEGAFIQAPFTEDEIDFIIAGSYIDTMASLHKGTLQPDMRNFNNLVISRQNYRLITAIAGQLRQKFGADQKKLNILENKAGQLKNQAKALAEADIIAVLDPKKVTYNAVKLGPSLDRLVAGGVITDEVRNQIFETLTTDPDSLGQKFGKALGKNMGTVKTAIKEAEE